MKLNRDDLSFALVCAKSYYYDSLNSDYPNKDDQKNAELFRDLEQEADNGALEIEGYERVGWIKFDPNDPKTFPPKNKHIYITNIYANHDERWACKLCEYYLELALKKLSSAIKEHGAVIHWRPLPEPPVESNCE